MENKYSQDYQEIKFMFFKDSRERVFFFRMVIVCVVFYEEIAYCIVFNFNNRVNWEIRVFYIYL